MPQKPKENVIPLSEWPMTFPQPGEDARMIQEWMPENDHIGLLRKVVMHFHWQTAELTTALTGHDLRSTCENIWSFCHNFIRYGEDPQGTEPLRSPAEVFARAQEGVDADSFAVLISSVLVNLGIVHKIRYVRYPNQQKFSHVYVLVRNGKQAIVLDPVFNKFDQQTPYVKKRDFRIEIESICGIPPNPALRENPFSGEPDAEILEWMDRMGPLMGYPRANDAADLRLCLFRTSDPAENSRIVAIWEEARIEGQIPITTTMEQFAVHRRAAYMRRLEESRKKREAEAKRAEEEQAKKPEAQKRDLRWYHETTTPNLHLELYLRGVPVTPYTTREEMIPLLEAHPRPEATPENLHKFLKYYPHAYKTRCGGLLGAKLNHRGLGKFVWALLPKEVAIEKGLKGEDWDKLNHGWKRWQEIHYKAGGNLDRLRQCLIHGAYNRHFEAIIPDNLDQVTVPELLGFNPRDDDDFPPGFVTRPISAQPAFERCELLYSALEGIGEAVTLPELEGQVVDDGQEMEPEERLDGIEEELESYEEKENEEEESIWREEPIEDETNKQPEAETTRQNQRPAPGNPPPELRKTLKWLGIIAAGLTIAYHSYQYLKQCQLVREEEVGPSNRKAGEPQRATKRAA